MPRRSSPLIQNLTSPAVLSQASAVLEAGWMAWGIYRKPRTSGALMRRVLLSGVVVQAAQYAQQQTAQQNLSGVALLEPLDAYKGPAGDVPVRISQTWEDEPRVHTVAGRLVVVAGTGYEKLSQGDQERAYRDALDAHSDPIEALTGVAVSAVLRYGVHRAMVGGRTDVSKKRSLMMAATLAAAEAGLRLASREIAARRRHARVARERS